MSNEPCFVAPNNVVGGYHVCGWICWCLLWVDHLLICCTSRSTSLIHRPSPPLVFDRLQHANMDLSMHGDIRQTHRGLCPMKELELTRQHQYQLLFRKGLTQNGYYYTPSVYVTLPHVPRSPRPPLSMFACCKWSKSGGDVYTSSFIIPTVRSSKHLRSYSSKMRPLLLFLHTATNRRQYQLENGRGQCHCRNFCGLRQLWCV